MNDIKQPISRFIGRFRSPEWYQAIAFDQYLLAVALCQFFLGRKSLTKILHFSMMGRPKLFLGECLFNYRANQMHYNIGHP
jgi:hypothetical protein